MSIPHVVHGRTTAEAWENSLISCYHGGTIVKTQYDIDPNTGYVHPPSRDCMMTMIIEEPLSEPRLHLCLIGGPEELGDYRAELVDGIRDHWVKKHPEDATWTYTYSGRIHRYGDRINGNAPESIFSIGKDDPQNPWVGLSFVRDIINDDGTPGKVYIDIPAIDQVQVMIDMLAEAPFTRRAIAETSFPPADLPADDPPCLRYIWARGYTVGEDNHTAIDMHTHWRSRDGLKAALFNMFGITELLRTIVNGVQDQMHERADELIAAACPICGQMSMSPEGECIADAICKSCGSRPYMITAGRYVDVSDSYHIYGQDIEKFENGFLKAIENRTQEDRFWNLEERGLLSLVEDGAERARRNVASRDDRDGLTDGHRPNDAADFSVPVETKRAKTGG